MTEQVARAILAVAIVMALLGICVWSGVGFQDEAFSRYAIDHDVCIMQEDLNVCMRSRGWHNFEDGAAH